MGCFSNIMKMKTSSSLWVSCRGISISPKHGLYQSPHRHIVHTAEYIAQGIIQGNRGMLAKAITFAESSIPHHRSFMEEVITQINKLNNSNHKTIKCERLATRIGITGPPGAGKSTFIEAFGMHLIRNGHKVAVIPVDPSSPNSGGSILGDQTRMNLLSQSEQAFIRASPTRGQMGGIAPFTSDVVRLCESCGYDFILVESVGLGQSEIELDYTVDMLILIIPPGSGDDLQASKKGIMEVCDLIIVSKADDDLLISAQNTQSYYKSYLPFIKPRYKHWTVPIECVSLKYNTGLDNIYHIINQFFYSMNQNKSDDNNSNSINLIQKKREKQIEYWIKTQLKRSLLLQLENKISSSEIETLTNRVKIGEINISTASEILLHKFLHDDH